MHHFKENMSNMGLTPEQVTDTPKVSFILAYYKNPTNIFNINNKKTWNGNEKLSLVTHHWAGNKMKGFDVYSMIDDMLNTEKWNEKISFTYIGNLPKGFKLKWKKSLSLTP